ncbi:tRNA threonylcarbamoyladenosine biosynthesis protein TsaE [Caulobacter ginsengisoli]|uniref:tRNA threonylcarbamoyladenosine biosynthesis protein TsaE n=1 Tax=Caulobacter ginsengisoli TaxID=400775 RepID=A0ABU0IUY9_9CAUL|nr:tRNA (adenosine(37)-N6)-threonylcarbamoyltransferase complex ATPase subunit type 1 TsaE [Caulobacter ginsengisoli]MDQ0465819.1 tRNA threonylcarbamoyladenosine biosynthesis protein TsaE [Caulobacter ginsengisoli]
MTAFAVLSNSPDQTDALARALAAELSRGDVVLLEGALAAGKTHFVKAAVAALDGADPVTSPTFSIVNVYRTALASVLHIDAYRLSGPPEFRDLGLEELIEEGVSLIEWGDRIASDFPQALTIRFELIDGADDPRRLTFSAETPRWAPVIDALKARFA